MFMFPLPFLTACLLSVLLARSVFLHRFRLPPLALLVLAGYAGQAILIGIKWGFHDLRPLPVIALASLLPLMTWGALCDLAGRLTRAARGIIVAAAGCLVVLMLFLDRFGPAEALDLLSTAQYVTFGALLIVQAFRAPPRWTEEVAGALLLSAPSAFFCGGALLFGSAVIDIAFLTRMALAHGNLESVIVGYGNFAAALIATSIFFRGLHERQDTTARKCEGDLAPADVTTGLDRGRISDILARLELLMRQTHLYRDENLTLHRLASQIDVPARQISTAVRAGRQMGVPQYVNSFRVADACRMLSETELPVTEIVFAVGFTTKSSFNREFARSRGVSPSVWRAQNRQIALAASGVLRSGKAEGASPLPSQRSRLPLTKPKPIGRLSPLST